MVEPVNSDAPTNGGPGGAGPAGSHAETGGTPGVNKGGRPKGAKDTAPRATREDQGKGKEAAQADAAKGTEKPETGKRVALDELRGIVPAEAAIAFQYFGSEKLDMTKEELVPILGMAFHTGVNFLMAHWKRTGVTELQADKWAKVTEVVFRKWLYRMDVGLITWGLFTLGICMSTKPLPGTEKKDQPKPKEGTGGQAKV